MNATCTLSTVVPGSSDPVDSSIGIFRMNYTTVGGVESFSLSRRTSRSYPINSTAINAWKIWVKGDGMLGSISVRHQDASGQIFQLKRTVDFVGWKLLDVSILGSTEHFGGDNDGTPLYPMAWNTLFALRLPSAASSSDIQFTPPFVVVGKNSMYQ